MRRYTQDRKPYPLKLKFAGKCAETGATLDKGADAWYDPSTRKVYHPDSKTVQSWKEANFDAALGYDW